MGEVESAFLIFSKQIWDNHIRFISLSPIMRSNLFKYLITCFLLVMYINRGLFVAAPGVELSGSHSEINSLLEVIISWAGGHNDIDEDGDCPETYNAAQIIQPFFDPNSMNVSNLSPKITSRKKFYHYNEAIPPLDHLGVIDQPPEQA